ncbi:thioredoxin-like protein [Dichomitus squalens]|uniref:Thioredoxin-like protein n=1 Tax=Dichomitus squalens TaxID=114155 RepID=A0A4Q9PRR0_9APHY|nr:thioredoxin-like protein [Dichomitus squalens]TBU43801.1 thioredoxin-like protein [Dichomitus squalens]TBU57079.1 thioredoxin-like protein [Dichomitus squalens]
MAINPNEDTEFNDALRKHGILPPKPPTPRTPSPPPPPTLEEKYADYTAAQLRELAAEAPDDETERLLELIRRKRLQEVRKMEAARFGRVYPISREDYTREITEASKVNEEGDAMERGTGVVVFLYKDGIPHSDRAKEHINVLAQRHPHTKFVSIVGDKCIPNLPDARLPMFIIYRKGEVLNQLVAWGADRERRVEELEAVLILAGAIIPQQRLPPDADKDGNDSDSDLDDLDDDDPSSRMRSASTSVNAKAPKNLRGKKGDESDSDFEFDL